MSQKIVLNKILETDDQFSSSVIVTEQAKNLIRILDQIDEFTIKLREQITSEIRSSIAENHINLN